VRSWPSPQVGLRGDGSKYTYVWKTDRSWAGTCRKFVLTLSDGTTHEALFRFKAKSASRDETTSREGQEKPEAARNGKSKGRGR
jgi:hypothetical protein